VRAVDLPSPGICVLEVFGLNFVISLFHCVDCKTSYAFWLLICASNNLECLMCSFDHVCTCTCVRDREHVHVCMCIGVCVCTCAFLCVGVCACAPACIHVCGLVC